MAIWSAVLLRSNLAWSPMSEAVLVYPHHLFQHHPCAKEGRLMVLIEDPLFFTQYPFHAKKLIYHRATMKIYQRELKKSFETQYVECSELSTSTDIFKILAGKGIQAVFTVDPVDDWLEKRLRTGAKQAKVSLSFCASPQFLTPLDWADDFFDEQNSYYFTKFYTEQRKRLGVLVEGRDKPVGGKWTFDTENRKKLPKNAKVPEISFPREPEAVGEARHYVRSKFPKAPGSFDSLEYPVSRRSALSWLSSFFQERFDQFGDYEDAIHPNEAFLFHSVLTPMINTGMITPDEVLERALQYGHEAGVALNSLEGFIRQVIGWREYMMLLYRREGVKLRTSNFWNHKNKIPESLWNGETGIEPVDVVIKRVLEHSYAHHIERLMILGNFMLLCEIDPDEIYEWFMALFIDAYDWVMVPNVYGMSQFAAGGLITTKPYISSSNYVRKMSQFPSGPWCEIWDSLYWSFVAKHRKFFAGNSRLKMMLGHLERMGEAKLAEHQSRASEFKARFFS